MDVVNAEASRKGARLAKVSFSRKDAKKCSWLIWRRFISRRDNFCAFTIKYATGTLACAQEAFGTSVNLPKDSGLTVRA